MSDITIVSNAGLDAHSAQRCVVVSELYAGEDLDVAEACYIGDDGKVYLADSSTAKFIGLAPRAIVSGMPASLFGLGSIWGYAESLTPGAPLYLSSTPGALADSGSVEVAVAVSESDIVIVSMV